MTTATVRLAQLMVVLALVTACTGCGDGKMRKHFATLDDATLMRKLANYEEDSKPAILVKEELRRRGVSALDEESSGNADETVGFSSEAPAAAQPSDNPLTAPPLGTGSGEDKGPVEARNTASLVAAAPGGNHQTRGDAPGSRAEAPEPPRSDSTRALPPPVSSALDEAITKDLITQARRNNSGMTGVVFTSMVMGEHCLLALTLALGGDTEEYCLTTKPFSYVVDMKATPPEILDGARGLEVVVGSALRIAGETLPAPAFLHRGPEGWVVRYSNSNFNELFLKAATLLHDTDDKGNQTQGSIMLMVLGPAAPDRTVPILVEALEYPGARENASVQLGRFGPRALPAVPALCRIVASDPSSQVQGNALRSLAQIGALTHSQLPIVEEALDRDSSRVRIYAHAALAAADKSPEIHVKALAGSLTNEADLFDAAYALSVLGPRARPALPALETALRAGARKYQEDMLRRAIANASDGAVTPHNVFTGNEDSHPIPESDPDRSDVSDALATRPDDTEEAAAAAWQSNFDAFVVAYQDAIREGPGACETMFAGKRIAWTMDFEETKTIAGKSQVIFGGVRRKLTKGGITGPWAQFFPDEASLPKWRSVAKGTRLRVTGTVTRSPAGYVTDNVTGERVPWSMAEIHIDAPSLTNGSRAPVLGTDSGSRLWTRVDGRQMHAVLVGLSNSDGTVKLRRIDGKVFEVSRALLSPEDRAFIEERAATMFPAE